MSISQGFIRKPVATAFLAIGITLIGVVAFFRLPISALPTVDTPTIQVTAQLPGADPQTMGSSVATPLERQFGQIAGLTAMTSSSGFGNTAITLQFALNRSTDAAAQDVQAAINAAAGQLPKTIPSPPIFRKVNPADVPVLLIALTSDTEPLTKVDDYADSILAQKLSQVPGVSLVTIGGMQKPSIRVQVNPAKLAAAGLDLEQLRTTLGNVTVNQPKGVLYGNEQAYTLATNDQVLTAKDYEDLIIAYRNGAPVRLRDIGHAEVAAEDLTLHGWYNAKPSVILAIQRQPGANVINTVDAIKKLLPQLEAGLPSDIKVTIASDRTQTIRASVADVQFTLLLTIALVVGVIFLFLRNFWATVIPAISVPISLIGTFGVMYLLNYSLDNLSLMGLSIAVGFVVDDAIVMIENISRHIEEGLSPLQAALKGAGEIGFTIISISVSLVAVFIPLLLMGGVIGRMFQEFAVTVCVAIAVSVIVSVTLTPMMCAYLLSSHGAGAGMVSRTLERGFVAIQRGYEAILSVALRFKPATLAVMLASVVATGVLFADIPKGFFPQQDTGMITGITEASADVSPTGMAELQRSVIDVIAKDPSVANATGYIGPGGPTVTENNGRLFVLLKPRNERQFSADEVIRQLDTKLAKLRGIAVFMQATQDINLASRLSKTQYQFTLTDVNEDELNSWAGKLFETLKKRPELADVASDQANAARQLKLRIDRDAASRLGIDPAAVDNALYDAFGQRHVAQLFTTLNTYYVILEVDPSFQSGPYALNRIYVRSSNGSMVPLSQFTTIEYGAAALAVNHQNQFPSVTLSFNLSPGTAVGTAVAAVQQETAALHMPSTIATSFQGNAQAFQSALASTPVLILAAIVAVYLILGMLYESTIHPRITILSTLPSAGLGALMALWTFGFGLDVIGLIGIILLIGLVQKNGIMLIDFALQAARHRGLSAEQSALEACKVRFRPILMTTMCAMLGGVPLMVGTGTGSELRQPLGFAIVGGLIVSQLLTLFTTPVVYIYLQNVSDWFARKRAAHRPPHPAVNPELAG